MFVGYYRRWATSIDTKFSKLTVKKNEDSETERQRAVEAPKA